jgi:hypothetical protein
MAGKYPGKKNHIEIEKPEDFRSQSHSFHNHLLSWKLL